MVDSRSLAVQSILYGNDPDAIVAAAEALANAARIAARSGSLGSWSYLLGDCGESPALQESHVDRIAEVVAAQGGDFSYTVFGENLGHGGGHNRLAPLVATDLILFLNPDAMVGPEALEALLIACNAGVGAVDGRQLPLEHPKDFDAVTGATSWASGACLLTPRAAFSAVGGFDDDTFFLYCDDVDYSWRVALAGYRVRHEPAARVFHDKRLTPDGGIVASDAEHYYSAEAALLLAHKYSRPEIVSSILAAFDASPDEPARRARDEYRRRSAAGLLPEPIDADHAVSQFVSGNYAVHRY